MTTLRQTLTWGALTAPAEKAMLDALDRIRAGLQWRKAYVQTRDELNKLSDRDLADLGIPRADINRLAREAADDARLVL